MQGSNGTKFQSIIGSLGQSSFTSPGKPFVPFPVLLPNQQKKMCSSSQRFFTQQGSKFSCLILPQSYWVHSHFCRDLPCEFTCSSWALRLPGTVPCRSVMPCFGEAAAHWGAVGLLMLQGCCSSTACALWYQLQFLCAIDTTQVRGTFPRTRRSSTGEQTDNLVLNTTVSYF